MGPERRFCGVGVVLKDSGAATGGYGGMDGGS